MGYQNLSYVGSGCNPITSAWGDVKKKIINFVFKMARSTKYFLQPKKNKKAKENKKT
jgi:hypothetical protein